MGHHDSLQLEKEGYILERSDYADAQYTLKGREEAQMVREQFYVYIFLSCHEIRILFHQIQLWGVVSLDE